MEKIEKQLEDIFYTEGGFVPDEINVQMIEGWIEDIKKLFKTSFMEIVGENEKTIARGYEVTQSKYQLCRNRFRAQLRERIKRL